MNVDRKIPAAFLNISVACVSNKVENTYRFRLESLYRMTQSDFLVLKTFVLAETVSLSVSRQSSVFCHFQGNVWAIKFPNWTNCQRSQVFMLAIL